MARYSVDLDEVFLALADPTRRGIVQRLGVGDASVGELAADVSMTLPSFLKHIRILERGGLVRTAKRGRVRTCSLERDRFRVVSEWMAAQRAVWESGADRLQRFAEHRAAQPQEDNTHGS